jgi:glucosamine-6-phosphate deaminase
MKYNTQSSVETFFFERNQLGKSSQTLYKIPVIAVDNYVELGQLTALRFLEWVSLNPQGVVALPTGRTPEFFIKWMEYYLTNWKKEVRQGLLGELGFKAEKKPRFDNLHFFQLDEFFPIHPDHDRSFIHFVKKYYIEGFGFDPQKTNLINTYFLNKDQQQILDGIKNLDQVFPDGMIDLRLRIQKPSNRRDELKQKAIRLFDQFCNMYEDNIREKGGIGFFLGGIGPDGHIAFNVKGSSHYSHTRLTNINYETQAAAASDLGGIELVRKKAVITMGLETITYNPDVVAIIIAAGESKSKVVADAVEQPPSLNYPASSLQKLDCSRFYITRATCKHLSRHEDDIKNHFTHLSENEKTEYVHKLTLDAIKKDDKSLMEIARHKSNAKKEDANLSLPLYLGDQIKEQLMQDIHAGLTRKIEYGATIPSNERLLHTAPHHDDIELAYFPLLHHLVRSSTNENHFCYCTSGFTSVTNVYLQECLQDVHHFLQLEMLQNHPVADNLSDFSYAQEDITGYLRGISSQDKEEQHFFRASRLARQIMVYLSSTSFERLRSFINELLVLTSTLEPGRKEPEIIHLIKGWLREFEAELVWAHFGIDMTNVHHLRLHFYTDDIFPSYPDYELDVLPILELMEDVKPTIVSLALDPEGSGPDTHYKTLIAIAEALDKYVQKNPDINLRVWGYRNVWSRFNPVDVSRIIPVSLNSFAVLHNMFNSCFLSQKSASFPSYELEGTFSELAQKIWVEQHNQLVKLLGETYFYDSTNPMLRRSFGAIYLKDMSYAEFSDEMKSVRRLLEAKKELES